MAETREINISACTHQTNFYVERIEPVLIPVATELGRAIRDGCVLRPSSMCVFALVAAAHL
jgi:hypothetical protein